MSRRIEDPNMSSRIEDRLKKRRENMKRRAEEEAIRREHTTQIAVAYEAQVGDQVFLIGEPAELGAWDPTKAVQLHWTEGNIWKGEVVFSFLRGTQYKYLTKRNESIIWEDGETRVIPASTLGSKEGHLAGLCSVCSPLHRNGRGSVPHRQHGGTSAVGPYESHQDGHIWKAEP
eukprot:Platyproteum_vivax@DN3659_c0_g1_i1.p1